MIYVRTEAPGSAFLVALEDFRRHTRREVEDGSEDVLLEAFLEAAVAHLDGVSGVLHRCLISQGWQAYADRPEPIGDLMRQHDAGGYSCGPLGFRIDLGPVQTDLAIAVSYRSGGAWAALDPDAFMALPDRSGRVLLALAPGRSWPVADRLPRAWRIAFTAGYGDAPEDVPAALRAAILLIASDLDNNRDGKTIANLVANPTVDRLLGPYRTVSV